LYDISDRSNLNKLREVLHDEEAFRGIDVEIAVGGGIWVIINLGEKLRKK
jgi:hypothetical protein